MSLADKKGKTQHVFRKEPSGRVETGGLQFEDDWPGYFIRGDECFNFFTCYNRLKKAVESIPEQYRNIFLPPISFLKEHIHRMAEQTTGQYIKPESETIMRQATTLGSPGKAVTFNYAGSVSEGVVIEYDYTKVSVNRDFFRHILATFRGRTIYGGFSKTDPTPDGFGEWVRDNSKQNSELLTPQHASRIAAILVAERYAQSDRERNAVLLRFSA